MYLNRHPGIHRKSQTFASFATTFTRTGVHRARAVLTTGAAQ